MVCRISFDYCGITVNISRGTDILIGVLFSPIVYLSLVGDRLSYVNAKYVES